MWHIISKKGVAVDPNKDKNNSKLDKAKNNKWNKMILKLGKVLLKVYTRILPNCGTNAKLLRNRVVIEWIDECEKCFHEIKGRLTTTPVVTMPKVEEPNVVYTDTFREGYKRVLRQNDKVIAYTSRQPRPYEKKLHYIWFGTQGHSTCIKSMVVLSIWCTIRCIYISYVTNIFIFSKGLEFKTKKMDRIPDRLRFPNKISSRKSQCSSRCLKQKDTYKFNNE